MIIDVWDLTCRMRFSRWEDCSERDARVLIQGQLREEIIYPRGDSDNRTPYLQNYRQPTIADFYDARGALNYDNAFFLEDMLYALESEDETSSRSNAQHLSDYFRLQHAHLRKSMTKDGAQYIAPERIVLVVPDSLSPLAQTRLLRYCGLPQTRLRLLWASIASALGAEEEYALLSESSTLMVVLPQKYYGYGVQLELTRANEKSGKLIPRRRCYKADSAYYPELNAFKRAIMPSGMSAAERGFVEHAYGCSEKSMMLPERNGNWRLVNDFPALQYSAVHLPTIAADCVIIPGMTPVLVNSRVMTLSDKGQLRDFIACGAARFAVRKANGLPTYFDQCERLSIIIQDSQRETIEAHTLIEAQERCDGGEEIKGAVNTDSVLQPQNSIGKFYLAMGEVGQSTALKYLEQDFGRESLVAQRLTMRPTMIPGQGVAQVSVEGAPLFKQPVQLDFLNMQNSKETLASLTQQLKRSFPIDMPAVKASRALWDTSDWYIQLYLEKGLLTDGGIFAKKRKINPWAKGLDALEFENVFGNHENFRIPPGISPQKIDELFQALADDCLRVIRRDGLSNSNSLNTYLRPIAWTYHSEFPAFKQIVHEIVQHLMEEVFAGKLGGTPVLHTVCANLLSDANDMITYLTTWIVQNKKVLDTKCLRLSNWNRSLYQILIFNNDALKNVNNEFCSKIVELLCELLDVEAAGAPAYKQVLLALLFMLKRRKYDHNFLRRATMSELFELVEKQMAEFQSKRKWTQPENSALCKMIDEFLQGNGSLAGLPAIIGGLDGNVGNVGNVGQKQRKTPAQ